ncbi:hypothetical protein AWH69_00885 [Janibacter melonis]|uniref:Glycosyltransferase 2-like domain-containing protein n=2 Tax=Janibacter melonis TaxID=262209 RepID=A0A176QFF2_9MICO|nr:hypothetical protein AWH69_00885 [Janibacter melonis]
MAMQRPTHDEPVMTLSSTPSIPLPEYPEVAWPALARTAGRFPGSAYYDDLARLATDDECDADALLAAARAGARPASVDARGVGWFAHVTASHVENPRRFEDVADLLELAGTSPRSRAFAPQLDDVWVQALHLCGRLGKRRDRLRRSAARPEVWWTVDTDALHPGDPGDPGASASAWLESFNRPFVEAGVEGVAVRPGPGQPFDRLTCDAPRVGEAGIPLVTVVIPVYNPGESLRTAVTSLLAQTWGNLEILLADDASSAGEDVFEEVLALDPRVRRVRAARNAGAYAARNLGMHTARGELVTFNDADDWAHPRRVEHQVRALLGTPGAMASMSSAIRVTEDLHLTVIGRPTVRTNLSSIMLRREEVLRVMGAFDAVRKGADTEFVERFVATHGPGALVEVAEPLSLVQLTSGSLSRDDYRFLRTHPARRQYVAGFRRWHTTIEAGSAEGFLPPGVRGPHPAPRAISGRAPQPTVHDVLVLANLAPGAPTVVDLASELAALADAGLDVAVREQLSPFDLTTSVRPPEGEYVGLLVDGRVTQVTTFDAARAALLVVRDPASASAMPAGDPPDVVDEVLVVADYSSHGSRRYDPLDVESRLATGLTTSVRWLPATAGIRDELVAAGCRHVMDPAPFVALGLEAAPVRTTPLRRRVAVYPGDLHRMGRPEVSERLVALTPSPEVATAVVVGPRRVGSSSPDGAVALTADDASVEEVAGVCDLVVIGATPGRGGHSHRAALRAMHAGCLVVADRELRDHLGDAAVYLDDRSVDEWVTHLVDHPEELAARRARSAEHARATLAPERLATLVRTVLDDRPEGRRR